MNLLCLQRGVVVHSHSSQFIPRPRPRNSFVSSFCSFSLRPCVLRSSSRAASCKALASDVEPPTSNYEFRDDKGEVELKVKLPEGKKNIGASNVFVDAEDTSISVTLALPSSLLNVLPPTRLYGRIKASETVWFVDEEEIVISLKKLDKEIAWPGLVEDWGTLTKGVSNLLKGVPVYLVGESADINWAVAQRLAEGLQYILVLFLLCVTAVNVELAAGGVLTNHN